MKYKISLSTYNMDIIEAFSALGNRKSQFIEQALISFISTEKGRDTLHLMVEHLGKATNNSPKEKKPGNERKDKAGKGSDKLSVDSFLK